MRRTLWVFLFCVAAFAKAHADAALLLEEPFGNFGGMNPTGHAAVYLTRVCAASPAKLRRCEPGEDGVVISRYHKIAGYDWLAVPLVPYLYAVATPAEIPESAGAELVAELRDAYRRAYLRDIAPDDSNGRAPGGEWTQLIGSSYDRKIYGFRIRTSAEQDDALIEEFNNRANKARFNILFSNCADFARSVLNFYNPHSIHRSFFADAGITTPKQTAKSLVQYSRRHPELALSSFEITQVAGSIHRSHRADGVLEAFLRSKKYIVPVAILHPIVVGGLGISYLATGRFNPSKNAALFDLARATESSADSEGATEDAAVQVSFRQPTP